MHPRNVTINPEVEAQLRQYVTCCAHLYKKNAFHNFEHASHVAQSVTKLLSRIVAPDLGHPVLEHAPFEKKSNHRGVDDDVNFASTLHDHTYGITSDPLTQFACFFSALIHDADHSGVPYTRLLVENPVLSKRYHDRSVAEQNSFSLAWDLLMDDMFVDFRRAIYSTTEELERFRELVVNSVMATDIVDKDLKALRNARWEKAFAEKSEGSDGSIKTDSCQDAINRKATIVIEHLIQASDVSHTMQHWHVYRKWNERLFREMYKAYQDGRSAIDPSEFWASGEIGFLTSTSFPWPRNSKSVAF